MNEWDTHWHLSASIKCNIRSSWVSMGPSSSTLSPSTVGLHFLFAYSFWNFASVCSAIFTLDKWHENIPNFCTWFWEVVLRIKLPCGYLFFPFWHQVWMIQMQPFSECVKCPVMDNCPWYCIDQSLLEAHSYIFFSFYLMVIEDKSEWHTQINCFRPIPVVTKVIQCIPLTPSMHHWHQWSNWIKPWPLSLYTFTICHSSFRCVIEREAWSTICCMPYKV